MNVVLRRKVDRAIADFLDGAWLDAEALLAMLDRSGLKIFDEAELEAHDEKAAAGVVQYLQDALIDAFKGRPPREMIDPKTRERVQAVEIDDIESFIDETIDGAFEE